MIMSIRSRWRYASKKDLLALAKECIWHSPGICVQLPVVGNKKLVDKWSLTYCDRTKIINSENNYYAYISVDLQWC